jgi:hypothetical protein
VANFCHLVTKKETAAMQVLQRIFFGKKEKRKKRPNVIIFQGKKI